MKNPLAKREEQQVAAPASGDPFVDMVERLSARDDLDADKIQKFLDMQIVVLDRQNKQKFYAAMNEVQAHMPSIVNDAWNDQTKSSYAKLQIITKALRPAYTAQGFSISFTQDESPIEGHIRVRGQLAHRDGHVEDHYYVDVPLDKTGIAGKVNKTDVHATGSSFTYGRRYLTCMMFDVATGDDNDAQAQDVALTDDEVETVAHLLGQLKVEDQTTFWNRARVAEGDYDELKQSRFQTYVRFLKGKGAVE
jgi:hypothetical protein